MLVVVAIAATAGAVVLWSEGVLPPTVNIPDGCGLGVGFQVDYAGNASGFVGWPPPPACPAENGSPHQLQLAPGSDLTLGGGLCNLNRTTSHTLTGVAIDPPFRLVSVSPTPPLSLPPANATYPPSPTFCFSGENLISLTFVLQVPSTPGNYNPPTGTLTVV